LTGVLTGGVSQLIWPAAFLTASVPVSLIGFWLTARTPTRMNPHVAR
jgi:hypothetical protein